MICLTGRNAARGTALVNQFAAAVACGHRNSQPSRKLLRDKYEEAPLADIFRLILCRLCVLLPLFPVAPLIFCHRTKSTFLYPLSSPVLHRAFVSIHCISPLHLPTAQKSISALCRTANMEPLEANWSLAWHWHRKKGYRKNRFNWIFVNTWR